ncbi:site-specific integrase [Paenibacillus anseongense]|uniref:tyrosine-type recombinase/integrase n=1 Tax=Paenibacillus anseongense TaxID=2682845 RepID=UPI002DBC7E08|nr:site-specific integrase [Paenibacillus anseongense]MEC0269701.1 site-specific integrase [Paenibacillus anseongense]
MTHLLLESNYYRQWHKLADVRRTTLEQYSSCLNKFEHYLVIEKGFSGELDFNKFFYYEDDGTYLPINEEFISGFFSYLESLNTTRRYLYMYVSALRNFFTFLKDIRLIKSNPMAHFKNPYYDPKFHDRSISLRDSEKLLHACRELDKSDPFLRMHSVLVLLMLTTGLRNKEIRELTIGQLDFQRNIIYVDRGQKTKANSVFMPKVLSSELQRLINHPSHLKWQHVGNNSVFFSQQRKKFNQFTINEVILNKLCKIAGVSKVTAHCLRHTMAALLLSRGVDVSIIQRQLRHKDIETTLRYLPTATIDEIKVR